MIGGKQPRARYIPRSGAGAVHEPSGSDEYESPLHDDGFTDAHAQYGIFRGILQDLRLKLGMRMAVPDAVMQVIWRVIRAKFPTADISKFGDDLFSSLFRYCGEEDDKGNPPGKPNMNAPPEKVFLWFACCVISLFAKASL